MSEWLEIDGAPRDGTVIIARGEDWDSNRRMMARAVQFRAGLWWRENGGHFTVQCFPTHWIPMPNQPENS